MGVSARRYLAGERPDFLLGGEDLIVQNDCNWFREASANDRLVADGLKYHEVNA
jgi:hypothetical protein